MQRQSRTTQARVTLISNGTNSLTARCERHLKWVGVGRRRGQSSFPFVATRSVHNVECMYICIPPIPPAPGFAQHLTHSPGQFPLCDVNNEEGGGGEGYRPPGAVKVTTRHPAAQVESRFSSVVMTLRGRYHQGEVKW